MQKGDQEIARLMALLRGAGMSDEEIELALAKARKQEVSFWLSTVCPLRER